jgi:hypothetical protein
MERPACIPAHAQVAAYLFGTASGRNRAEIEWFRKNDPVWALFFTTLDRLRRTAGMRLRTKKPGCAPPIPRYRDMEPLFESLCAQTIGKTEACRLLSALLNSPVFFDRWLRFLSDVEPAGIMERITEPSVVRMQSDDVLLARIRGEQDRRERLPRRRTASLFSVPGTVLGRLFGSIPRPPRRLKWALPFAAVLLVLSAALFNLRSPHSDEARDPFVYDDRVPYEYDAESFRGASSRSGNSPEFDAWTSAIRLGVSNYLLCDYRAAVAVLQDAGAAKPGTTRKDAVTHAQWERDRFYYGGLSHLALWRTRSGKMDAGERSFHGNEAIRLLAGADSVAQAAGLENNGREAYFMGLILSLQERPGDAAGWLEKIRPESAFYTKASSLMDQSK